jgi:hypothetical protein
VTADESNTRSYHGIPCRREITRPCLVRFEQVQEVRCHSTIMVYIYFKTYSRQIPARLINVTMRIGVGLGDVACRT